MEPLIDHRLDPCPHCGARPRLTVPRSPRTVDPSRLLRGALPVLGLTIALLGPTVWSPPVGAPGAAPFAVSRPAFDRSLALVRSPREEMIAPVKSVARGEAAARWRAANLSAASGEHDARQIGPWPPSLRGYAIFFQGGDLAASVPRTRRGAPVITSPTTERATPPETGRER